MGDVDIQKHVDKWKLVRVDMYTWDKLKRLCVEEKLSQGKMIDLALELFIKAKEGGR